MCFDVETRHKKVALPEDDVLKIPLSSNGDVEGGPVVEVGIHRASLNQAKFDECHGFQEGEEQSLAGVAKNLVLSKCEFSRGCLTRKFLGFFPFLGLLRTYQWKKWIIPDIISGVSLGAINVPQGLGFALLCSLPPVYGLYSSLFPPAIYFFFGTSNHISVGTMSLICLMTGAVVDREFPKMYTPSVVDSVNATLGNGTELDLDDDAAVAVKVGIATSLCLLMGLFQLGMGMLNMGILASYMSTTFVHAFLSGAAYHILLSQLPLMMGLKLTPINGIGKVPLTVVNICAHLPDVNPADVVGSIICILTLVVIKEVINVRFKKRLKIPIPAELIVLILGTVISHLAKLNRVFDVRIVGTIPAGLSAPAMPPMQNAGSYVVDAFFMAIISFTICISMAKMFAARHRYEIDTNQEILAYGLSFAISSFFYCFPGAQAPPRTFVHESVGGKTQVSGLISSLLLLLVCLTLGPVFKSLPICVLASIITVAILPLFKQARDFPNFWRVSRLDGAVWILTLVAVIFLDLIMGLVIGMAASVVVMLLQAQFANVTVLSNIKGTEIYRQGALYKGTQEIPGVNIFRFNSPLFFANVEFFKERIFASVLAVKDFPMGKDDVGKYRSIELIVLDCSALTYVDFMGVATLKQLNAWCKTQGVHFALAECSRKLISQLMVVGMIGDEDHNIIFPTVYDAVVSLMDQSITSKLATGSV